MVDRSSCCYFWRSDFCFCSETIFVTKYRVQSRAICGFFICWIRCFSGRRRKCEILSLIESLSFTYTANVMFKLRISQIEMIREFLSCFYLLGKKLLETTNLCVVIINSSLPTSSPGRFPWLRRWEKPGKSALGTRLVAYKKRGNLVTWCKFAFAVWR